MEESTPDPKVLESQASKRAIFLKKAFFGLIAVLIIIALIAAGYYFFNPNSTQKTQSVPASSSTTKNKLPNQIVAKVGQESIYQQNIDSQIANFPAGTSKEQIALEQLTSDSIILQGGAREGLIKLDERFFNSKNMDPKLRILMVEKVKTQIENQADKISGKVVSIWFLNNEVGPLGYDKAKQLALEKITKLHKAVKSNKITIDQAGKQIQSDTSLAQLDPAYKANAIFDFTVFPDQSPTWSKEMDSALLTSKVGSITDIFTIKSGDLKNQKLVDAYYSFGQVTQKISNGKIVSFDNWFNIQKGVYEVQIF